VGGGRRPGASADPEPMTTRLAVAETATVKTGILGFRLQVRGADVGEEGVGT
jgi:hypothetical protein